MVIKSKKPMSITTIKPRTVNQERIFREYAKGQNLLIHGYAGTGKTLLTMYLALSEVMNSNDYDKLMIIRSCVPARAQGFLPGGPEEKDHVFEVPYDHVSSILFENTPNAYKALKGLGVLEFVSTSYLRGQTIEKTIVLADEFQNFNEGEVNTVITRIGESSRLIICGDEEQDDLQYLRETSCVKNTIRRVKRMPSFSTIKMEVDDVCRNGLIREWILAGQQLAQDRQNSDLPQFIREG